MTHVDSNELERRLAARTLPAMPPALRTQVLAEVRHALERSANSPGDFMTYAMPAAAGVLVCANLLLTLFSPWRIPGQSQQVVTDSTEPFAFHASLLPGESRADLQKLDLTLRASGRLVRPSALPAPVLRSLLREESSSWITP